MNGIRQNHLRLWRVITLLVLFGHAARGVHATLFESLMTSTITEGSISSFPVATFTPDISPTPSPTITPTFTVTNTFTSTPSHTPTYTPTLTPSRTPTEIPRLLSLAETRIVYTCFVNRIDQICVMNGDGSNQRQLTAYGATSWYGAIFGDRIFYSSMRSGTYELYSMSLDGSDDRRITTNADGYAPALSPDGRQIAFAAKQGNADQDIYVVSADGTNMRRLTFEGGEEVDPIWSPDGREILFSSNRHGIRQLYTMNPDGSNWDQITTTGQNGRSDWSPDGRYITYYAGERGAEAIYIANRDGSDARLLTPYDGSKAPSFSPDSNWITFASTRDGDLEVYIMRIDGSQVTQLTFNDYSEWQPRWER